MQQQNLDLQASRIEAVLGKHKVEARVIGGTMTPRLIRFDMVTRLGTKVSKVASLAEEIALALGYPSARIYRQSNLLCIEVPRENPKPIGLHALCREVERVPPLTAVLGMDDTGLPLLLRLSAADVVHVLIAGTTGSGKTALARTMLASLAMFNSAHQMQLLLIDPKRRGFGSLAGLPHVCHGVIDSNEEALDRLQAVVREMERRDQAGESEPALILAVDELADLIGRGGKRIEALLARLAQRGRQAGIHLLACTQKPTASLIGSSMKANFPVRLVGSVASRDEARYATGISDSGAEKLNGQGDFLLITKGDTIRFQAAWMTPEELSSIVRDAQEER